MMMYYVICLNNNLNQENLFLFMVLQLVYSLNN